MREYQNRKEKQSNLQKCIVTEVQRSGFTLRTIDENDIPGRYLTSPAGLSRIDDGPYIGDYVLVREEYGSNIIESLSFPGQRSPVAWISLSSSSFSTGREEIMCCNCDNVFIFSSMNDDFNIRKKVPDPEITPYI